MSTGQTTMCRGNWKFGSTVLMVLLLTNWSAVAEATWSIVAVEPETGTVGLAAATCGLGVQFIAGVTNGAGVVAAQGATSFKGRDQAGEWMQAGLVANDILERLGMPEFYDGWFDPEFADMQYGVATLAGDGQAGFVAGERLIPWSGGAAGEHYAVQGNTLRSASVVVNSATAFEQNSEGSCRLALGERLLRALEAGRDAGGDNRCPAEWPAYSAILVVAGSGESIRLVTPREIGLAEGLYRSVISYAPDKDDVEPILQLRQQYEAQGGQRCLP